MLIRPIAWGVCLLAVMSLPVSAQGLDFAEPKSAADWAGWSLDVIHGPRVQQLKGLARHHLARVANDQRNGHQPYGLQILEPPNAIAAESPLVIVVHGLNSTPQNNWGLLPPTTPCLLWCGSFAYPNDQPLAESARLLSHELRLLRSLAPERPITLVTHSMGGLVARACIENPALNPGGVTRLIMVAPPTHGSLLARFALSPDIWEHWLGRRRGTPWQRSIDAVVDGLGEAASDLVPGSPFLTQLDSRQRAPETKYTVILGTSGAGVQAWQLSLARAANRRLARGESSAAPWCELADELLGDLDEVVRGRGDGVVAVKRGRLAGVEDLHLVDFRHTEVNSPASGEPPTPVQQLIAQRLGLSLPAE